MGKSDREINSVEDYTEYGFPAPLMSVTFPEVRIRSVRLKNFPVFGEIVDARWQGDDSGLGIISGMNDVASIKRMAHSDLEIRAYPEHQCWILSTKTKNVPSRHSWSCYQAIAEVLVAVPIP